MSMPDPAASSALILSREASTGRCESSSLLWYDWGLRWGGRESREKRKKTISRQEDREGWKLGMCTIYDFITL